ncbi:hypothetical protein SHELI_v1c01170 [Spiroplasma helicoides]|uniref:Uncharacterized protein n=1 Tax=Spiroplasma helicoides TaxID=216938 RepID=A0A1B3SJH0_9MOLU|nr:hypothetical protein [Spiroplasma helicoides]AOG60072.1 hypothetical protein SHELI_v1c01170 [Spiroplasma helicoides]
MLSTRQSIFSTIIGTLISLINSIIQLLTMYFVLQKFGTHFNGYVRLVSSFSMLISTAESSLGVAATILMVRPIVQNDWITANEIYSTSKKLYRKASITELILVFSLCLLYPVYAGVTGDGGSVFDSNSWSRIGIELADTQFVSYWTLIVIAFSYSLKNFIGNYWFNSYECVVAADNKNTVRKVIILFTDVVIYMLMFLLLSFESLPAYAPFLVILAYSPIKGSLIAVYVKRKYVWLKYYRDFNSFKLTTTAAKISRSSIGTSLLINLDVIIAALVLGLGVSSTLSLYLVIAVNTRLIMTNFITSFREFFVTLVAKRGRIHWESYVKYELYTFLVASFTFINMSILSPYFVSSLYAENALNTLTTETNNANFNALSYMFYNPTFSIIYALSTAFIILCQGQITLIHAKGRYGEVSKFQNILGVVYLFVTPFLTYLCKLLKVGGEENELTSGIIMLYSIKIVFLIIRYLYLWVYVWRYATYNSTLKHVWNNVMILVLPSLLMSLINVFVINKNFDIKSHTNAQNSSVLPLISLFFGIILVTSLLLIIVAYAFSPKTMNGIIKNMPIINKIIKKKDEDARKKRFEENGIDVSEIVDKASELSTAMYGIIDESTASTLSLDTVKINVESKNDKIYVLKGNE